MRTDVKFIEKLFYDQDHYKGSIRGYTARAIVCDEGDILILIPFAEPKGGKGTLKEMGFELEEASG